MNQMRPPQMRYHRFVSIAKGELNNSKRSLLQVQAIVREPWAEVNVSDMCRVFVVQVRCMHVSGTGYWSKWSHSVYSSPQNSRGALEVTLKP